MSQTPIIVISSPKAGSGKTTLALNLSAALWTDGYKVFLLAPDNDVAQFLQKRREFCNKHNIELPMPQLVSQLSELPQESVERTVVIADIPTEKNNIYTKIFSQAHTLITVADNPADVSWNLNDDYINLIWDVKKNIAARGIKYLNWIVVADLKNENAADWSKDMGDSAKKYGFRIAPPLKYRQAYQRLQDGYCAADMVANSKVFAMTFADVYARREILKLTDDLWQQNKM
ncbi:MAG: division plane positioning ATPase MipZ [Alphaproteobacteria bacterium]|nr:division plane positioning ATPase MipZ [Alphaproteobacteria bacterium]